MKTITLNTTQIYKEGRTSKYWREVECELQTVELKSWSSNQPFFILSGKIVKSHDEKEIGMSKDVYVQTYDSWLQLKIDSGVYAVNN